MNNRNSSKKRERGTCGKLGAVVATLTLAVGLTAASEPPALTPDQRDRFDQWRNKLEPHLVENGISSTFAENSIKALAPAPTAYRKALQPQNRQQDIGSYITAITSADRIEAVKRELLNSAYKKIETTYGVSRSALAAISQSSAPASTYNVVNALAVLSALDRPRADIWQRELVAALRLAENEKIPLAEMRGAWNGASGRTHLHPTTFEAFAQDFDKDGKHDLWKTGTHDTIATTANTLRHLGWRPNASDTSWWGYEVRLPDGFDFGDVGLSYQNTGDAWGQRGVTSVSAKALPPTVNFSLLIPQGARGPAFLVTDNFQVLRRLTPTFSRAPDNTAYALGIALLADRATGHAPIRTPWRTIKQLTRSQRMNLQELLVARGYDTGGIDGILGRKSVIAIREEQRKRALPQDGFADQSILGTLQHSGLPHVGEAE